MQRSTRLYCYSAEQTLILSLDLKWDFGDQTHYVGSEVSNLPSGNRNVVNGYHAAHVYDIAGTYTVKLTVGSPSGLSVSSSVSVPVASDSRPVVSFTQASFVANPLVQLSSNTIDEFGRGGIFELSQPIRANGKLNTTLRSFGSGDLPYITYNGSDYGPTFTTFIDTSSTTRDLVVQDDRLGRDWLGGRTFWTLGAHAGDYFRGNTLNGVTSNGLRTVVRNVHFSNVNTAVATSSSTTAGNLILDTAAPDITDLRTYLSFISSPYFSAFGNIAANSVGEHIIRGSN